MEAPSELGYDRVFRVIIVQFMDRFNFCVGGVKRSCIHFVTPEMKIIPFDTYNLFYRPGAAGNAALEKAQSSQLRPIREQRQGVIASPVMTDAQ